MKWSSLRGQSYAVAQQWRGVLSLSFLFQSRSTAKLLLAFVFGLDKTQVTQVNCKCGRSVRRVSVNRSLVILKRSPVCVCVDNLIDSSSPSQVCFLG